MTDEACATCDGKGYLLDQTYGYTFIPFGAVSVQRCDSCQRYIDDRPAARQAARDLGTAWGGNHDPDTGEIVEEALNEIGEHLGPISLRIDPHAGGTSEALFGTPRINRPVFDTGPGDCWVWLPLDHPLRQEDS